MLKNLGALGPSGLMAMLLLSPDGMAETEPVVETRLLAVWNGADLEVTPYDTFDVYLKLRVEHGSDDFWLDDGPHRLTGDATISLSVPWPDLSHKGDLVAAPAVVTGFVRVYTVSGADLGSVPVERRLWFAGDPDATLPQDALASTTSLVVDEGFALATAAPEALVAAGVSP